MFNSMFNQSELRIEYPSMQKTHAVNCVDGNLMYLNKSDRSQAVQPHVSSLQQGMDQR